MGKPLFENVGNDLKEMAEIKARWIRIKYIMISILTIVLSYIMSTRSDSVLVFIAGFVVAILIFMYGISKADDAVIEIYAYGELVERVMSIEEKLEKQNREMEQCNEKNNDIDIVERITSTVLKYVQRQSVLWNIRMAIKNSMENIQLLKGVKENG